MTLEEQARELAMRLGLKTREIINGLRVGDFIAQADKVTMITEALRQVASEERERAASVADKWATSESCEIHDNNPCCHVRTGAGIAAAIRSLEELP